MTAAWTVLVAVAVRGALVGGALVGGALLGACGPSGSSNSKPAGTHADPVETCERFGDVCRIDKAKLGVCAHARSGSGFTCASQH